MSGVKYNFGEALDIVKIKRSVVGQHDHNVRGSKLVYRGVNTSDQR